MRSAAFPDHEEPWTPKSGVRHPRFQACGQLGQFHVHVENLDGKLGIGECGTSIQPRKPEYIKRYYTMKINVPGYVGGYFWWWYRRDMVPYTKLLWSILNEAMSAPDLKETGAETGPAPLHRP